MIPLKELTMKSECPVDNISDSIVNPEKYTAEELTEFYDRLEKYNTGEMPVYSIEEAHNYIRRQRNLINSDPGT